MHRMWRDGAALSAATPARLAGGGVAVAARQAHAITRRVSTAPLQRVPITGRKCSWTSSPYALGGSRALRVRGALAAGVRVRGAAAVCVELYRRAFVRCRLAAVLPVGTAEPPDVLPTEPVVLLS